MALFVRLGNISSQLIAGALRLAVESLPAATVGDSLQWDYIRGQNRLSSPEPAIVSGAREFGVDLSNHRADVLTDETISKADVIFSFDAISVHTGDSGGDSSRRVSTQIAPFSSAVRRTKVLGTDAVLTRSADRSSDFAAYCTIASPRCWIPFARRLPAADHRPFPNSLKINQRPVTQPSDDANGSSANSSDLLDGRTCRSGNSPLRSSP